MMWSMLSSNQRVWSLSSTVTLKEPPCSVMSAVLCHDQGRLVAFNLGNVFNAGTKAEGFEKAIADTVERLRPAYEKAKALGVLDHAYIYGFDERPKEQFALLERSVRALREEADGG